MTLKNQRPAQNGDGLWRRSRPVFAGQLILLLLAAWFFRHALNPDAVAYLELARHYAAGQTSLAISGHWSPLISWLIAGLLHLRLPLLPAARVFMILSAVIFLAGCGRLFRRSKISGPWFDCGMWVAVALSIPWSVENITPDLLLGGLVSLAFAEMIPPGGWLNPGRAVFCGILWSAAFLCKSVALPLALLTLAGMAVMIWKKRTATRAQIIRTVSLTLAGLAPAAVWITVLSAHYGTLTVARSGTYNHSLVGPEVGTPRFLLDEGLRVPPPGRMTIWEDPTAPAPDWSPVSSWRNAAHQSQIVLQNLPKVLLMLTGISLAFPIVLVCGVVRALRRLPPDHGSNRAWAWLPVLLLAALFLPNYLLATEQRYFYGAMPLLFVLVAGHPALNGARPKRWLLLLVAASFLAPTAARAGLYLGATRTAGECARVLAARLEAKHLEGPVVGSGRLPGGRAGLYTAWLLQQPWYGDEPAPSAADYESSGARLIIVNRGSPLARELSADRAVRNLDSELFAPGEDPEEFPLQVFEKGTAAPARR